MISQAKLTEKITAKKRSISQGVTALQRTINGYDFDASKTVKLRDHQALVTVQQQAADLLTKINELGVLKNVAKGNGGGAAAGAGRVRRNRAY